jgi:Na+/H+ antiporter NhaA
VLLIIALFGLIILLEIAPLAREQQWKELIAASLLLTAGFILSMLITLGFDFPYLGPVISSLVERLVGI